MTKHGKKKHVIQELVQDECRLPGENQRIVKVLKGCGNDIHEVEELGSNENYLVSMPGKFRKTAWVKRGSYVIVNLIENGGKIKAEIDQIIMPKHKVYLKKNGVWPEEMVVLSEDRELSKPEDEESLQHGDNESESGEEKEPYDDAYNFVNTNRKGPVYIRESSSSSESD